MPINAGSRVVGLSRAAVAIGSENEKNIGTGGAPMVLNPYLERLLAPVSPGIFSITIKGKALNFWGIFYALSCLVNAIVVLPFLILTSWSINLFASAAYKNKRTLLDWIIHVWAKAVLLTTGCNPTLYGEENLPPHGEPVIYVPNHTSFMDILTLSGFVPRPFKYLSKEEIVKIPVIGYAMKLAQHVFLKRNDITSIDTVTDAVTAKLKNGCGMVLFAEGTRSKDGVLKAFKKGAFKMAKAANVRIVPISIGNLHRFMPPSALMPLGPLRNIYIKVHPPIDTLDVPVNDLRAQTWEAVNSGLPPYQQGEPSKRMIKAANNKDGDE
jgi:1-acyl-sn-glycerol-3-phosphate acyltransferase